MPSQISMPENWTTPSEPYGPPPGAGFGQRAGVGSRGACSTELRPQSSAGRHRGRRGPAAGLGAGPAAARRRQPDSAVCWTSARGELGGPGSPPFLPSPPLPSPPLRAAPLSPHSAAIAIISQTRGFPHLPGGDPRVLPWGRRCRSAPGARQHTVHTLLTLTRQPLIHLNHPMVRRLGRVPAAHRHRRRSSIETRERERD